MNAERLTSPLDFTSSCRLPDSKTIRIYDSTLRDGEQMPGVAMSPEQKFRIAKELSILGCHILDVGFPVVSADECRALQLILDGKQRGEIRDDVEIVIMCRAIAQDIDKTISEIERMGFSTGDVVFELFTSASPLHVRYKLGPGLLRREGGVANLNSLEDTPYSVFHQANLRMVREGLEHARARGVCKIEFGGEDSSRTPLELLLELLQTAADAGMDRCVFADTIGTLTPESTLHYCTALTKAFPNLERVSHFHNDFGLATANVITGVLNGFTTFTTTVNGLGERAGNASLHTVVTSLKYLYGLEIPNFQYDRLNHIKRVVEEISGVPVAAQEPVIGHNAFSHESGIHTHGVAITRAMYEPIPYEDVGGIPRFVYGKHSGLTTILNLLREHSHEFGTELTRELANEVLEEVKACRIRATKNGTTGSAIRSYYENLEGMSLSPEDVLAIAKQSLASLRVAKGA